MNRRAFFGRFGAAVVGLTVTSLIPDDLERLLWVPGRKTIFLPTRTFFLPAGLRPAELKRLNTFLAGDWVTKEALRVLERNLAFTAFVNREYDANFVDRQSAGLAVRVHLPERFA